MRCGSLIVSYELIFDASSNVTAEEATDVFAESLTNDAEVNEGSGLFLTSNTSFDIQGTFY